MCKCFVYKKNSSDPCKYLKKKKKKSHPQPIMLGNIIEVLSGNAVEKACIDFYYGI